MKRQENVRFALHSPEANDELSAEGGLSPIWRAKRATRGYPAACLRRARAALATERRREVH